MILNKKVQLERMTWQEVKTAVKESKGVALIPIGAMEEHGPHLPVGTDSIETYEIARLAAVQAGVVVAPLVWYGNSRAFMDFPGTITLQPDTVHRLIKDIALSLIHHGFNKPVIVDGHGGNYGILDLVIEDIHLETGALATHVRAWEMATIPKPEGVPSYDGHAGSSETSAMLYLMPDDVAMDKFEDSKPEIDLTRFGSVFPSPGGQLSHGPVVFSLMMGDMVKNGHHGDPKWANAERGKALIEVKAKALGEFLIALKQDQITLRKTK
ncbi:MAG: creatininase family protein [Chloroflexi bacterium]|nr:creatininase family protein [Chloroflexota bacterium]